ncbi:hypothetical protein PsAD46_03486 [Pseudovibrio sp. Ad46]|nr:hypothetical protein PsAD46_03486 [Pseudovibrio sp. Ad46]
MIANHHPAVSQEQSTDQFGAVGPRCLLDKDPVELLAIGNHLLKNMRRRGCKRHIRRTQHQIVRVAQGAVGDRLLRGIQRSECLDDLIELVRHDRGAGRVRLRHGSQQRMRTPP